MQEDIFRTCVKTMIYIAQYLYGGLPGHLAGPSATRPTGLTDACMDNDNNNNNNNNTQEHVVVRQRQIPSNSRRPATKYPSSMLDALCAPN
jgi:hypothetical protein